MTVNKNVIIFTKNEISKNYSIKISSDNNKLSYLIQHFTQQFVQI